MVAPEIICALCNKYRSSKKSNVKRHYVETHGLNSERAEDLLNPSSSQNSSLSCHACPRKVSSMKQLIEHINSNHFCGAKIEECAFDSKAGRGYLITFI